jgi:hypothetical protein
MFGKPGQLLRNGVNHGRRYAINLLRETFGGL